MNGNVEGRVLRRRNWPVLDRNKLRQARHINNDHGHRLVAEVEQWLRGAGR